MAEGRNLYNKHRPKTLDEFVGNSSTIKSLKSRLKKTEIPNAFLFSGNFGCGKTSLARTVAKELKTKPIDVKELNNASMRGIDDIRDIERSSRSKPMASKHKVVIVDEAHMLTTEAKNAILKWLEDPPKHLVIILCTTEPAKLGEGIRSRCIHLSVKPLSEEEIMQILSKIIEKEGLTVKKKALNLICNSANGCPRTAINLLETSLDLSFEDFQEQVENGIADSPQLNKLFQLMLKKATWNEYATLLKELKEEPETIRRAGLGYFSAVLLNQAGKQGFIEKKAISIIEILEPNWYDAGRASLIRCCYEICVTL